MSGWMDGAGLWHGGFLRPILHCVGIYKNYKGTSLWNFVLNPGIKNFTMQYAWHDGTSIDATFGQVALTKVDANCDTDKLDHQLSWHYYQVYTFHYSSNIGQFL